MLCFSTPSPANIEHMLTFGLSAKASPSAIGQFGTGLKHAIANVLRLKGEVIIHDGENPWEFFTQEETVRGKTFQTIHRRLPGATTSQALPCNFTTHLGSTWEPWEVYRELASNTLDEKGTIIPGANLTQSPFPQGTNIYVYCDEVEAIRHSEVFLSESNKPLYNSPRLSIYPFIPGDFIYYKSVRVAQHTRPNKLSYNFHDGIYLSEDRGLKYPWQVLDLISKELPYLLPQESLLLSILTPLDTQFERELSIPETLFPFILAHQHDPKINPAHLHQARKASPSYYEKYTPSPLDQKKLLQALNILAKLNKTPAFPIVPVVTEPGALGHAYENTIYLSQNAFAAGTRAILKTLIEEDLHLRTGVQDFTYEIQHAYLDMVIELMSELTQEPI